jgi:hypothetical protein
MTPSERRRQSHNWSNIEDALDAGWILVVTKEHQKKRYKALLESPKDSYESKQHACLEWALDEIDEWLEDEFG